MDPIPAAGTKRAARPSKAGRLSGGISLLRNVNGSSAGRPVLWATAAAIVCHVLWGFSFMASRTARDIAGVFVLLSHRFCIALLAMHLFPRRIRRDLRLPGRKLWLLAALGLAQPVCYFFSEQYGILHSTTIFSGVMIAMIPVVSTLAAAPILRERPTWGQLIFSLVSVAGVIGIGLLSGSSGRLDAVGVIALTGAVLSAAAYMLLARGLSASTTPFARTYVMIVIGAVAFTVPALIQCRGDMSVYFAPFRQTSYTLSVLFLGLLCSVACFFLSNYAVSRLTVARETVFSNLTTAVSVFAGAVFLHEPFSPLSLLFCLLILAGIWGVQKTAKKSDPGKSGS